MGDRLKLVHRQPKSGNPPPQSPPSPPQPSSSRTLHLEPPSVTFSISTPSIVLRPAPSVPPMAQATLPAAPTESTSVFWLLMSFIYSTIYILQRVTFSLVYFATYTLPTWLFTILGMSLTFTMNFTTLYTSDPVPPLSDQETMFANLPFLQRLIIFLFFGSVISWAVRYRILNKYKWLPPEPQRKEPEIDLFPDSQEGDSKAGFSSYLDEFLSAIKVFGYLERPVFHELTRSMQTRKLIAGMAHNFTYMA